MTRVTSLVRTVVFFALLFNFSPVCASPAPIIEARDRSIENLERRAPTPNSQGYYYSRYYKWWSDGGSTLATYVNYLQSLFL